MSWRLAIVILLTAASAMASAQEEPVPGETDGPVGAANAGWAVQEAFAHGEYAKLDELIAKYCDPRERLDDGRWKLSGVSPSLQSFFQAYAEWEIMFQKLAEWRRERPDSTAVNVVEAMLWRNWGWAARGNGYAGSVTPEGWQLFRERLGKAVDVLARSRDKAGTCPWYYEEWLYVLLGLGSEPEISLAVFETAVKQFPDYTPLYYRRAISLAPEWGGSFEEIDAFIDEMVRRNLGNEDEALYTRLYWWLDLRADMSLDLFHETPALWSRMKNGFDLLRERYPHSNFILNSFAAYACRAEDEPTYHRLRVQITKPYYASAWSSDHSIEVCDARLMKKI